MGIRCRVSLLVSALQLALACDAPPPVSEDEFRIGALLPFTGGLAAPGANIEHAMILAAEQANAAGGVAGRKVRIVARDTHSEVARGLDVANELIESGISVLVGPEEGDLALQLVPTAPDRQILIVSGGSVLPTMKSAGNQKHFFRTAPANLPMASALAKRIIDDGVRRVSLLFVDDAYGQSLSESVADQFTKLGGQVVSSVGVPLETVSYRSKIDVALAPQPEALVLLSYPRQGSDIVQDATTRGTLRWYLCAPLKSEVFVRNVSPGSLAGAIGVAPAVAADAAVFAQTFSERFDGDIPLLEAYFNYDAVAVIVLAAQAAATKLGRVPTANEIREQIVSVSSSSLHPVEGAQRPQSVGWYDVPRGFDILRNGGVVDYRGTSGSVDIGDDGELLGGLIQLWRIDDANVIKADKLVIPAPL